MRGAPKKKAKAEKPPSEIDRIFYALGDPTRRAIVEMLSEESLSVSQLAAHLPMTLTAVGQHLQILEDSGLVRSDKAGRIRTCHVATAGFAVLEQWAREHKNVWERRLDRLGDLLGQPEK